MSSQASHCIDDAEKWLASCEAVLLRECEKPTSVLSFETLLLLFPIIFLSFSSKKEEKKKHKMVSDILPDKYQKLYELLFKNAKI